jgi:hypothetical protein
VFSRWAPFLVAASSSEWGSAGVDPFRPPASARPVASGLRAKGRVTSFDFSRTGSTVPDADSCDAEAAGASAGACRASDADFPAAGALSEPECGVGDAAGGDAPVGLAPSSDPPALEVGELGPPGARDAAGGVVEPCARDPSGGVAAADLSAGASRAGFAEGVPDPGVDDPGVPSPGRARANATSDVEPDVAAPAPDETEGLPAPVGAEAAPEGTEPGDAAGCGAESDALRGVGEGADDCSATGPGPACPVPLVPDMRSADGPEAGASSPVRADDERCGRSIKAVRRSERGTGGRGWADRTESPWSRAGTADPGADAPRPGPAASA